MLSRTLPAAPALAALLLSLPGCIVAQEHSFVISEPIEGIVLDLGSGDAWIEGTGRAETRVDIDFGGLATNGVGHEVVDGVLFLDYVCGGPCGGELHVAAPAGVWVDVRVNSGSADIDGITGDLRAAIGAGDLTAGRLGGRRVSLAVGAGSVVAELDRVPELLLADVGTGDAQLTVPAGDYRLALEANGVVETSGVRHDPAARGAIQASTGAGELVVRGW